MAQGDARERSSLWSELVMALERNHAQLTHQAIPSPDGAQAITSEVSALTFDQPRAPDEVIAWASHALGAGQVHVGHPRYFGPYNPSPSSISVAAEALVAAFNPQLAIRSHALFATEVERHLIEAFGRRFGLAGDLEGTFCSGGAEANHTALLVALQERFPKVRERGLRGLDRDPVVYVSAEGHHSILKAARASGLGGSAVETITTRGTLRMDVASLHKRIVRDRQAGRAPFMIVATAGTTSAGTIDPLPELVALARREDCWLHVDAAFGGLVALVPELAHLLEGIGSADSITFDAHKALAVPIGAGLYISPRTGALARTFQVRAGYMPTSSGAADPYASSLQWSRRFLGLKLLLPLMVHGWSGYERALRRQVALGVRLRVGAAREGWKVVNEAALPVCCLQAPGDPAPAFLPTVARRLVREGEVWVSMTKLDGLGAALRASVNHDRTAEGDVDALLSALGRARDHVRQGSG